MEVDEEVGVGGEERAEMKRGGDFGRHASGSGRLW